MREKALILEDGTIFNGREFGSPAVSFGEVVFNTSMTGYQELITNQVYHNQIVVFTQPNVGNLAIQSNIYESIEPTIKGVVVRNAGMIDPDDRRSLDYYLKRHNIPGITDIDTRALVHHLRSLGRPVRGSLVPVADEHAFDQLNATVLTNQQVAQVSTPKTYPNPDVGPSVVVIDFGLKNGILRELSRRKCNVTVLPYDVTAEQIMQLDPAGVVLSSGPGDPHAIKSSVIEMIQKIQATVPLFAIGLGHELFALANETDSERLPIEYHGNNHPIQEIVTDHIIYAQQTMGYRIKRSAVNRQRLFITYVDLLTDSVIGLRHKYYPAFSVQFFPDGAPGPDDANPLFDEFVELLTKRKEL